MHVFASDQGCGIPLSRFRPSLAPSAADSTSGGSEETAGDGGERADTGRLVCMALLYGC